jgi:cell division transport system ATP-binding protein
MIQSFHVYKTYARDVEALVDINLQIEKGEFVFVVGPSGAGKTTLLRLIFRDELPTSGQILVNGRNVAKLPSRVSRVCGAASGHLSRLQAPAGPIHRRQPVPGLSSPWRPAAVGKRKVASVLKMVGLSRKAQMMPIVCQAANSSASPSRGR